MRSHLPRWGMAAVACLMLGLSNSGCLVTDQIDLPARAQTPPVLSSTTPMVGRVIRFNTALPELQLNIRIRDEDTTEILKARWRLVTGNNPPRTPTTPTDLDYKCPEDPIAGGAIEREQEVQITFPGRRLIRGQCYRIDVAVSSSFKSCERSPELFDITTNEDNEQDVGRASYVVFPLAAGTVDNATAQMLLESCPQDVYQPPTSSVEK